MKRRRRDVIRRFIDQLLLARSPYCSFFSIDIRRWEDGRTIEVVLRTRLTYGGMKGVFKSVFHRRRLLDWEKTMGLSELTTLVIERGVFELKANGAYPILH